MLCYFILCEVFCLRIVLAAFFFEHFGIWIHGQVFVLLLHVLWLTWETGALKSSPACSLPLVYSPEEDGHAGEVGMGVSVGGAAAENLSSSKQLRQWDDAHGTSARHFQDIYITCILHVFSYKEWGNASLGQLSHKQVSPLDFLKCGISHHVLYQWQWLSRQIEMVELASGHTDIIL